jgi:hypothetical protein
MAKVWKLPSVNTGLPKINTVKQYEPKPFYSLFEKIDGKWKRISNTQFDNLAFATRVYAEQISGHLIAGTTPRMIRQVTIKSNSAEGISHFPKVRYNDYKYDRANWEYR